MEEISAYKIIGKTAGPAQARPLRTAAHTASRTRRWADAARDGAEGNEKLPRNPWLR